VVVRLRSGEQLDSGVMEAPGEPDDPGWEAVVQHKVRRYLAPADEVLAVAADPPAAALASGDAGRLVGQVAYGIHRDGGA